MQVKDVLRNGIVYLILSGALSVELYGMDNQDSGAIGESFVQDGQAGFVVTYFDMAVSPQDASETGACPDGMSRSYRDIFSASEEGQQREGELPLDHTRRVQQGSWALALLPNGEMICMNPGAVEPGSHHRMVSGQSIPVHGIDLDGVDSRVDKTPAPDTCVHDDFPGVNGETGVDNQLFRVAGCMRHYQPSENSNGITLEMLSGSWGLLFKVTGVDDIYNDSEVEVSLYSNADPIQIGASRDPLFYSTYAAAQDHRFRATAKGRIVDGVLISEPVDFRFRFVIADLRIERMLHRARVHLTIGADGSLDGVLAGYTPIEDAFDQDFGYRNATDASGQITPYRLQIVRGAPDTVGYTCQGVYRALYDAADGDPDPETGECGSISTQYRIRAVPAFVVDVETQSVNSQMEKM